jgi:uncharacterized protein (DUF697 family)
VGAIRLLSRGVKVVRPVADAVRTAEAASLEGGEVVVVPGGPEATRRIRELLGSPAPVPSEDALAVFPATAGADLELGAAALARRRRSGAGALAVLVGGPGERAELERELLRGHRLEPSSLVHVNSLEGQGGRAVQDAVLRELGGGAVAAGRRNPGLRPIVGKRLVRETSRQAAAIGALPLGGADMPVLALMQVRMVAELAALHDRPFGAERAMEAAAVIGAGFGAGFGWRALGRGAIGLVPYGGWAAQGAIAYATTRAIGEAALARLSAGHDLIEGPPLDAVRPHVERVLGRLRRG